MWVIGCPCKHSDRYTTNLPEQLNFNFMKQNVLKPDDQQLISIQKIKAFTV